MIRSTSDFDAPSSATTETMNTDLSGASSSVTDGSNSSHPVLPAMPASVGGDSADNPSGGNPAGNSTGQNNARNHASIDDDDDEFEEMDEDMLMEEMRRLQKRLRMVREDKTSQASSSTRRSMKRSKSQRPNSANTGKVIVNNEVIAEPLSIVKGSAHGGNPEGNFFSASETGSPERSRIPANTKGMPRVDTSLINQSQQVPIPQSPHSTTGPSVIITKEPYLVPNKNNGNQGETGSSVNHVIEVDANQVSQASNAMINDLMEGITMRFRQELIESEHNAKLRMEHDLEQAARNAVEQEAWTAHQTVEQLEASALLAEQRQHESKVKIEIEAKEYAEMQRNELKSVAQQAYANHAMHEQNIQQQRLAEATLANKAEMRLSILQSEAESARKDKEARDAELAKTNDLVRELQSKVASLTSASSQQRREPTPSKQDNEALYKMFQEQMKNERERADERERRLRQETEKMILEANKSAEERGRSSMSHLEKMMINMLERLDKQVTTVETLRGSAQAPKPLCEPVIRSRGRSPSARPATSSVSGQQPSTIDMLFKRNTGSSTVTITQTAAKTHVNETKAVKVGGNPDDDPDDDDDDSDSDKDDNQKQDNNDKGQDKRHEKKGGEKDKRPKKGNDPDDDGDGDGNDDDDDDHDGDDPDKRMKKILSALRKERGQKEADVIKLLSLPEPAQFRAWRQSTRNKIVAASSDPDKAYKWIKAVEDPNSKFEDFRDSGNFTTLDSKLGSAISDIAKGDLGRKITLANEKEDKLGNLTKGRQLLRVVYEHFRVDEFAGVLYSLTDLITVRMKGDTHSARQLELFINTWDHTLAGVKHEPTDDVLEALFLERVRNCSSCPRHWNI